MSKALKSVLEQAFSQPISAEILRKPAMKRLGQKFSKEAANTIERIQSYDRMHHRHNRG